MSLLSPGSRVRHERTDIRTGTDRPGPGVLGPQTVQYSALDEATRQPRILRRGGTAEIFCRTPYSWFRRISALAGQTRIGDRLWHWDRHDEFRSPRRLG